MYLIERSEFNFNGKIFKVIYKVNAPMPCNVKNVVYMITCCGCDELYIGVTYDLRERITTAYKGREH